MAAARVAAALLVTSAVVACSSCAESTDPAQPTAPPADASGYVEPAWMAQTRQAIEEDNAAMVECMRQSGWAETVAADGALVGPPGLTEEQERAHFADSVACLDEHVTMPTKDEAFWRVKYARALDTRDCLVAAGHKIPDPPSESAWVDAAMTDKDLWTPFQFVVDQLNRHEITMTRQEYITLYNRCPQDGPTASMAF